MENDQKSMKTHSAPPAGAHTLGRASTALPVVIAIALFTFILFKLQSLFIAPANIILCFLLVGHPLGALLGARFYPKHRRAALVFVLSTLFVAVLGLLLNHALAPPLLPPWVPGAFALVDVAKVTGLMGLFELPFFIASGVIELLILRDSRDRTGRMAPAYALLLLGTLSGLALGYSLLDLIGTLGILALCLTLIGWSLSPPGRLRPLVVGVGLSLVGLCVLAPSLERRAILAIQPSGDFTTRGMWDDGGELLLAAWDAQSYTQLIEHDGDVFGYYNSFLNWSVSDEVNRSATNPLEGVVYDALEPESRVAVIGVGGGRQVLHGAHSPNVASLDAFELNETVVDYFANQNPASNGGAYRHPRVSIFAMDGRRGVLEQDGEYDCIYLPEAGSVLGYYRTMTLDLNFLHTREAYQGYLTKLAPGGLLAAGFYEYANWNGYVTNRLGALLTELGLDVRLMEAADDEESSMVDMVLAARPGEGEEVLDRAEALALDLGLRRHQGPITYDPERGPLPTDDIGLNLMFEVEPAARVSRAFYWSLAISLFFVPLLTLLLSFRGRADALRRGLFVSVGLGVNFVMLENLLILQLAKYLWNMVDAVIVGSTLFLIAAIAGALSLPQLLRRRPGALALLLPLVLASFGLLANMVGPESLALLGTLCLALLTGALFPLLLERHRPESLPRIYAADSLGALLGTILVFFIPNLHGVHSFAQAVAAVFIVVTGATLLHTRITRKG